MLQKEPLNEAFFDPEFAWEDLAEPALRALTPQERRVLLAPRQQWVVASGEAHDVSCPRAAKLSGRVLTRSPWLTFLASSGRAGCPADALPMPPLTSVPIQGARLVMALRSLWAQLEPAPGSTHGFGLWERYLRVLHTLSGVVPSLEGMTPLALHELSLARARVRLLASEHPGFVRLFYLNQGATDADASALLDFTPATWDNLAAAKVVVLRVSQLFPVVEQQLPWLMALPVARVGEFEALLVPRASTQFSQECILRIPAAVQTRDHLTLALSLIEPYLAEPDELRLNHWPRLCRAAHHAQLEPV